LQTKVKVKVKGQGHRMHLVADQRLTADLSILQ